jgi:hypothetical protein
VEAVDELEPQRDQQSHTEQREHAEGKRLVHALDVIQQAVDAVTESRRQKAEKNHGPYRAGLMVELGGAAPVIGFCLSHSISHFSPRAKISGIKGPPCNALMKLCRNNSPGLASSRQGMKFVQRRTESEED